MSVIVYSHFISNEIIYLSNYTRRQDLIRAVKSLKYIRGLTFTDVALNTMREKVFQPTIVRPGVSR